jgi:hypothetical protein
MQTIHCGVEQAFSPAFGPYYDFRHRLIANRRIASQTLPEHPAQHRHIPIRQSRILGKGDAEKRFVRS